MAPAAQHTHGWPSNVAEGWHWLERALDGERRLAFFHRRAWRVADAIGRTTLTTEATARRLYHYVAPNPPPHISAADVARRMMAEAAGGSQALAQAAAAYDSAARRVLEVER